MMYSMHTDNPGIDLEVSGKAKRIYFDEQDLSPCTIPFFLFLVCGRGA